MTYKTIFDFMKDKEEYDWDVSYDRGGFKLVNKPDGLYAHIEYKDGSEKKFLIESDYDLIDLIEEELKAEIRICTYCGGIMDCGYTDDDADFYNHEECFPKEMDERYGAGNWRPWTPKYGNGDEGNSYGGYYEYFRDGKWHDEPSYYTEWY